MITKSIKVFVKAGHHEAYLAAQDIWNRKSRRAPGYVGERIIQDPNEPNVVYAHIYWRSRDDLNRFIANDHDHIAILANADDHYDRIDVRILEGQHSTWEPEDKP
jgi:heme-degrading monooxygenase HmoA